MILIQRLETGRLNLYFRRYTTAFSNTNSVFQCTLTEGGTLATTATTQYHATWPAHVRAHVGPKFSYAHNFSELAWTPAAWV